MTEDSLSGLLSVLEAFSAEHLVGAQIEITSAELMSAESPVFLREYARQKIAAQFCGWMAEHGMFDVKHTPESFGEVLRGQVFIVSPDKMREFARKCFEAGIRHAGVDDGC